MLIEDFSDAEISRHECWLARVRREIAEIRAAAEGLRERDGRADAAVAAFLEAQARALTQARASRSPGADLPPDADTDETPGRPDTAARSALLIARAWHQRPSPQATGRP